MITMNEHAPSVPDAAPLAADDQAPPELTPADEAAYLASLVDDDTNAGLAEREFLTALLWAPAPVSEAVAYAILGSPAQRATTDLPADLLPAPDPLFVNPIHRVIFTAIVAMIDEGQPVSPALVLARLDAAAPSRRHRQLSRSLLLELTAPAGYSHPHHGHILPHLAAALVESWYRRGYIRFIDGMRQGMAELPTSDLAGLRDDLITMSRAADTRMLAITDRLARI